MPPLTRQQIQELLATNQITPAQHQALVQRINQNLVEGGEPVITSEQVSQVLAALGDPNDTGFGPGAIRPFTRSSFDIPLPFTDETIGVNAPLLGIGATLATLGIGSPAVAAGAGAAATTALTRSVLPGLATRLVGQRLAQTAGRVVPAGARSISRGRVTGAGVVGTSAFLGSSIIGSEQRRGDPVTPTGGIELEDEGGFAGTAASRGAAAVATGAPPTPQLGGQVGGGAVRQPILDQNGEPTGGFITILNGEVIDIAPAGTISDRERFTLESSRSNQAQSRADRQAFLERRSVRGERGFANAESQREAQRQRDFTAEQSSQAQQAALLQALLPILSRPGSRFRFTANLARLQGQDPTFTPMGGFNDLFRVAGTQQGQALSLSGNQNFSIIPNIQQLAELGQFENEELDAIIEQLTGGSLARTQRQSRRLAPPGGGGPRAVIGR